MIFFSLWDNPQSYVQWTLKFTARFVTVKDCNGERFDVSELILSLDNDEFRLSSGKESGLEGLEVHGYLPAPSEIPEREIGGGDHHI